MALQKRSPRVSYSVGSTIDAWKGTDIQNTCPVFELTGLGENMKTDRL